jgi:Na+/proline symporter
MNAYALGIIVSIAIYLIVGGYAGRRVRHLDDYYVAGRQAPTLLIVGTLVASLMSTTAFLGEVGMAYSGFGAVLLTLVAVNITGYTTGAILFGRHLRRSRALTVAEYFGQRFASRRVQVAAGITIIVGLGAYLVAVTQGAALIVTQVTDFSYPAAIVTVWVGYTAFTMYSGSRGVIITDTIMFLLFSLAAYAALAFIVAGSGGWFATIDALATYSGKPGIIAWHGATGPGSVWTTPAEALTWALVLGLAWSVVVAVSPWQASRYMMARNEHTVLRAACGASLTLLFMYPVLMLCGAAINLGNPGIRPAETAMIWAAFNLMPKAAGVTLVAGIMAAALSSSTTFLSLVGFSATNDIVAHPMRDEQSMLRLSRLAMLGVGFVALLLALAIPPRIFWITYFAATVFASSWGPAAFMSVWSRTITADGAFWGIVVGFVANVSAKALSYFGYVDLPVWADPIIIGVLLSIVAILLVSRRGTISDAERRYRENLHVVPESEYDEGEVQGTMRWPWLMITGGVVLSAILIVFWALPYRATTKTNALLTGEVWLSLSCGFVLVACGLLLRRHLRRGTGEPGGRSA